MGEQMQKEEEKKKGGKFCWCEDIWRAGEINYGCETDI